jgi:hypothetical protein
MSESITIEQLENLVSQMEADESAERDRLVRMIKACVKIMGQRASDKFRKRARKLISDSDGDNSYPPKTIAAERSGPALYTIYESEEEHVRTTQGFYHDWRCVTVDQGLYADRQGNLYGRVEIGTGSYGQFAAHPGDCHVDIDVEFVDADLENHFTVEQLRTALDYVKAVAFPLVAARQVAC